MKKLITLLVAVVFTVSAYAFDFGGKTFSGTISQDGVRVKMTYVLKSNGRVSASMTVNGRTQTGQGTWQVSGDYLYLVNDTGDTEVVEIGEENGKTVLYEIDEYGNHIMTLRQTAAGSGSKKTNGSKKKKR